MSFKFTLFGIESTDKRDSEAKKGNNTQMAQKNSSGKKRKLTSHNKKFSKAATECHKTTRSPKTFGKCMSRKLTSSKSKKKGKK